MSTSKSMMERIRPEESLKASRIAEHEDDIVDMQEFFRFSGLSVTLSRQCAEHAISMDANSPKKLFKYLEEVEGFYLTDLGMDGLEADMVLKSLKKEFGVQVDKSGKSISKKKQNPARESAEYDYKSDSSEDYEEKTESVSASVRHQSRMSDAQIRDSVIPPPRQPLTAPFSKKNPVPMLKGSQVLPSRASFSGLDSEAEFKTKVRAALDYQSQNPGSSPASYESGLHSLEVSLALGNLPPKPSFRGDEEHKYHNDSISDRSPASESAVTGTYDCHASFPSAGLGLTLYLSATTSP